MRFNTKLRPAGHTIITDPECGIIEAATLQCVHCGFHWEMRPGSGNVRGFCTRCSGPVCGPKCSSKCVPDEQRRENMEQGRPVDWVPVKSTVPRIWIPD